MDGAYFSQHGEDRLAELCLGRRADGFYVDVGAFDGLHLSNTAFFERLGWRGVCVEAHPRYAPLCRTNRPNAVTIEAAVVGDAGQREVTFLAEPLGLLSGVRADRTPNMQARYAKRAMQFEGFERVTVAARTLGSILDEHGPTDGRIDLVSIDTEGTEAEILGAFDFERWRVGLFIVEANDRPALKALEQVFKAHRYVLARELSKNAFFVPRAPGERASTLAWAPVRCEVTRTAHPLLDGSAPDAPEDARERRIEIDDNPARRGEAYYVQEHGAPLSVFLGSLPAPAYEVARGAVGFVHGVNFFDARPGSDWDRVMRLTQRTMRAAAGAYAGSARLVAPMRPADEHARPEGFGPAPTLTRSSADFGVGGDYPLVFDIIESIAAADPGAEYLVFTNADIAIQPGFYGALDAIIRAGAQAGSITRRTLAAGAIDLADGAILAETGQFHSGHDCVFFPRSWVSSFVRNDAVVGRGGGPMRAVMDNLVALASPFVYLRDVHLTCHVGDDKAWQDPSGEAAVRHNTREHERVRAALGEGSDECRERLRVFTEAKGGGRPGGRRAGRMVP